MRYGPTKYRVAVYPQNTEKGVSIMTRKSGEESC